MKTVIYIQNNIIQFFLNTFLARQPNPSAPKYIKLSIAHAFTPSNVARRRNYAISIFSQSHVTHISHYTHPTHSSTPDKIAQRPASCQPRTGCTNLVCAYGFLCLRSRTFAVNIRKKNLASSTNDANQLVGSVHIVHKLRVSASKHKKYGIGYGIHVVRDELPNWCRLHVAHRICDFRQVL